MAILPLPEEMIVVAEELTSEQRAIVDAIQELARGRKPLNIAAVKRHSPELLKRAFSVRPFWGWKRALEAAGLDYQHINIALEDYVRCEICGYEAAILTFHLLLQHEVEPQEYREEFPAAPVVSETVRAAKMAQGRLLPHWEPIWSAEYVLDRVAEFHRRGWPLHFAWIAEHEKALSGQALFYHGSWDAVLQRVGLDPAQVRRLAVARSLSKAEVVQELQRRKRAGLPLNSAAVQEQDLRLSNAMRRRFGSYARALEAAKIVPATVCLRPYPYSATDWEGLLAEVRRVAALGGAEHALAWTALRKRWEGLAHCRRGWARVCRAADVSFARLLGKRFPDKAAVVDAFRKRLQSGQSISTNALFATDRPLYTAARRFFGKYERVYRHLGVKAPRLGRVPRYRTKQGVIQAIQSRQSSGQPLNSTALQEGPTADYPLFASARRHFGSWPAALTAAQRGGPLRSDLR